MSHRSWLQTILVGIAAIYAVALVAEEIPRVMYPWDVRIFSEPEFLTNMVKLTAGQAAHTDPADANSFIYAPGLEYITFAVLRPLGLSTDMRACRAVVVFIGIGAAVLAGRIASAYASLLSPNDDPSRQGRRTIAGVAAVVAASIIFKNYTSDACHPDNLHILHALGVLTLTYAALRTGRFEWALAAMGVGAFGILVKQTACFGPAGAAIVLLYFQGRAWGLRRCIAFVACGLVSFVVAAWILFHGWGAFWTLQVPSKAAVEWFRLHRFVATYWEQMPYRAALALAFAPSVFYVAMRSRTNEALKKLFVSWFAIGCGVVIGSTLSYFKAYGFHNSLTILDVWMSMPIVGALSFAARKHSTDGEDADKATARRALSGGVIVTLFLALIPTRAWPSPDEWRAGREIEHAIAADRAAGKRVTISMGTAFLVRNGMLEVPLDRSASLSELDIGGLGDRAKTHERIKSGYYDKIYVVGVAGYSPPIMATIGSSYRELPKIEAPKVFPAEWDYAANMYFLRDGVRVFEKPN